MNARNRMFGALVAVVVSMTLTMALPAFISAEEDSAGGGETAAGTSVLSDASDGDIAPIVPSDVVENEIVPPPVDDSSDLTGEDKDKKDKKPDEPDPDETLEPEGLLAAASSGTGDGSEGGIYSVPTAVDSVYTGAAVYNIPIVVPPGRKGVQPSLALTYNSYTSNGWVGVGWDLEIGSIERSTKRSMNYSANDYVSSRGGELVSRSSDWGPNYYGAKVEGAFSKYYYNSSTSGWEVMAKDGTKYYYGSTTASRLNNGPGNFKWCLDKVLDTNGNYMTVSYTKDSGQIYPQQIDYTGNTGLSTTKSVVFTLEDRTDTILSYKSKTQQTTAKRLQKIATYADGYLAREYVLSYTYNPIAGQSQLTQVQTKGANDETTVQPTLFAYNTGGGDGTNTFPNFTVRPTGFGTSKGLSFGDINGDGRDDLVQIVEYGTGVFYVISYIGYDGGLGYHSYFLYGNGGPVPSMQLGDVDGDGCADIVISGLRVYKSLGNGSFGSAIYLGIPARSSFQLADINGDGRADLITHDWSSGYVYSYLANGSGTVFNTSGSSYGVGAIGSGTVKIADVNGDGYADLLIHYTGYVRTSLSSGVGGTFTAAGSTIPTGGSTFSYTHFSDINGDGLTDIIASNVFLSAGNGSFIQHPGSISTCYGVADVNGDGLGDLIRIIWNYSTSQGEYRVRLSKGNGDFYPEMYAGRCSTHPSYGDFHIADVNGDGLADPMMHQYTGDSIFISLAAVIDGPANYLSTVTNELGGTSAVTYSKSSIYPDNYCSFILNPVSQIVTNDGSVISTTQYTYQGATYDYDSREFWGFEFVKKTNPDGSKITTNYLQSTYLKGKIRSIETRDPNDVLLKDTTYSYSTYSSAPDAYYFVKLIEKQTIYENNSSFYSKETYSYDDTNGNLLANQITGKGVETIYKTNTYVNKGAWVWRPYQEYVSGSSSGQVRRTTNTYEANTGNLLTTTYYNNSGSSPVVSMTYDGFGNVASVTDAELNETHTTYDVTYTYPVIITLPATGSVSHTTYQEWDNRFGTVTSSTDQNGFDTYYSYDGYGRLTQVDYPDGGQVLYTYYDTATPNRYVWKQVKETSSSFVSNRMYYDGLGRVFRTESDGESGKTIITRSLYDAMGRNYKTEGPLFSSDTQFPWTQVMSYDYLSRPLTVRSRNTSGGYANVYYAYAGFSTTVTDADGNQKTQTTDHLGRIIKVEEQNSGTYTTTYTYNAAGALTRIRDANSNNTTFTYDTLSRKKTMSDPDMGYWQYTYDGNGNLLTQTDAKNQVITFTYDELNRVTSKTYSPSNPMVWYFYDSGTNGIGQPYQVVNANATTTYNSYDSMGRSTSVTKTVTGDSARTTQYTYDLSGKVLRTTYPGGYYVTNAYIAGTNLLSTVTGSNGTLYATSSNYKPTGKIGTLTHANGTVTTYTYSAYTTRVSDIITMKGSTTLQSRHYEYFDSGDIDTVTDNLTGVTYDYAYDDLHRLTDETNTGGFGAMHVTYDAIGNITQKSVGANTFYIGYDSSHKHAVDYVNYNSTNYDYIYDANGNMTQGYDFSNLSNIRVRTIAYNVDNMPTSIIHGSGTTAALLYDGTGARVKKTVTGGTASTTYYIGNHFEVKNGVATKYFFAGNLRVAQMAGSTTSYFHKDHLGSSTVMTNSSGTLLESTNFEPFGGQRAHTGTDTSAYKFTDQEFDAENGLYNYDARMYDPVIGRFLTPDSIIPDVYNPQALNRYSYCLNNPLRYTDPTGHWWLGDFLGWVGDGIAMLGNNLFGLVAGPILWAMDLFRGGDNPLDVGSNQGSNSSWSNPGVTKTGSGGPGQMDEFTLDELVVNGGPKTENIQNNSVNPIDSHDYTDIFKIATGFLSMTDGATMVGIGFVATAGTAVVTKSPYLTGVIFTEMLPVFAVGIWDINHGFHMILKTIVDEAEEEDTRYRIDRSNYYE